MPTMPRYRYDSLDLWRGIACLLVVAFHSANGYVVTPELRQQLANSGGSVADWLASFTADLWLGVPMFFVISGYCIAAAADSARRKPNPARLFITRRFRRIYPPLWAFLGICTIAMIAMPAVMWPGAFNNREPIVSPYNLTGWNWLGMFTLTEEWRPYIVGPRKEYLCGHLWTLCYEEQFYAVAGLLVLFARRWFFAGCAVVSAGVLLNLSIGRPLQGFFFDGLWLVFATGIAVYYRVNYANPFARRCIDFTLLGGLLSYLNAFRSWTGYEQTLGTHMAIGCGFALLLGQLHCFDGYLSRLKFLAPIRFCGKICYSLYLVHAPIAVLIAWNCYRLGITSTTGTLLITLPLGMGLSVLAGWAFHRGVERRFMNTQTVRQVENVIDPLISPFQFHSFEARYVSEGEIVHLNSCA